MRLGEASCRIAQRLPGEGARKARFAPNAEEDRSWMVVNLTDGRGDSRGCPGGTQPSCWWVSRLDRWRVRGSAPRWRRSLPKRAAETVTGVATTGTAATTSAAAMIGAATGTATTAAAMTATPVRGTTTAATTSSAATTGAGRRTAAAETATPARGTATAAIISSAATTSAADRTERHEQRLSGTVYATRVARVQPLRDTRHGLPADGHARNI